MGHSSSRPNACAGGEEPPPLPSRFERFRRRLHLHDRNHRGGSASGDSGRAITVDEFAGIARIRIIQAELGFKDKFFACLSLGERTYRTETSEHTQKPVWNSEKKVVVETNGPHIARISVYETNRFSKNTLVGYCEVDLFEMLSKDLEEHSEELPLLDPSSSRTTVGNISISYYVEDPVETEQSFARRVLEIVDYNEDGKLSLSEFSDLMNAFGNRLAVKKIEELFSKADTNGDGIVDMDELAVLLTDQQQK